MTKRRLLITHYDLDGIGCDILLSNMFEIAKKHHYGYGKIKECIESPGALKYDSVLVTDVSLTEDQFKRLHGHYKEAFLFVDHHPASLDLIREYKFGDTPRPTVFVNDTMSATAIIFNYMKKYLRVTDEYVKSLGNLAMYIDSYDMWRHKTHPGLFKVGYDLNTVFWKLGFNRFSSKFRLGYRGFDKEDKGYIEEHEDSKNKSMESSEKFPFNGKSLFVFNAESKYVNDYSLTYTDYDVFYIVYMYNDMPRIGVRTTLDNIELGTIVRSMVDKFDCVMSAGGHPKAAGVDFIKDTSLDDITKVAEAIDEVIKNVKV